VRRALFYLNGHNWLASKLRSANISYELQDNAFAAIGDWQKAQQLSDRLMVKQLHTRLDAAVAWCLPDLEPLGRYHWSILQAEYATDIVFRGAADLAPLYDHMLRTAIHAVKVTPCGTLPPPPGALRTSGRSARVNPHIATAVTLRMILSSGTRGRERLFLARQRV
jgi:hypothetical protein